MKQSILLSAFVIFSGMASFAQKTPSTPSVKDHAQSIIIQNHGSKKEKTTIVIDGDNVTVNGKPLKEYKGDIQITETDNSPIDLVRSLPPLPPVYPGGAKSYTHNFSFAGNSAFLGVYAEANETGVEIRTVTKNSPAEKAGLKQGDIITKIDSDNINEPGDLMESVGKYKPADKVIVTYMRDKKENKVSVTLEKNNQQDYNWSHGNKDFADAFKNFSFAWDDKKVRLGLRIEDLESGTGVKITDINDDDAPAAKAGLQKEDIITQIDGKKVSSVKDAKEIMETTKRGDDISVSFLRDGMAKTATVHIPKPVESSDL